MYRKKATEDCQMPDEQSTLKVLVLNASLKHAENLSNTEELALQVCKHIEELGPAECEVVRLADKRIPVGLGFRESDDDEWPDIVEKIKQADILLFATPVWWGQRSSLMQRVIERMDALDEEYHASNRNALLNKVAGIIVTGSEDGAQQVIASIMEVLTFMGFTLPPECAAYWVGEVGKPPSEDREKRLQNESVKVMAKKVARNASYYARLLKLYPLQPKA